MQTIATIKNMIEDDDRISQEHAFLVQNGVYWLYHVLSTLSEILFTNIHQILLNASFRDVLNYFNFTFNFNFNYFNFFLNIFYIKRTSLKKKNCTNLQKSILSGLWKYAFTLFTLCLIFLFLQPPSMECMYPFTTKRKFLTWSKFQVFDKLLTL